MFNQYNETALGVIPAPIRTLLQEEILKPLVDQDVVILEEPVINVRRSIAIVYNTDNILSTVSAALIKRLIKTRLSDDHLQMYDFTFHEIGTLLVEDVKDGYLWIGLQPNEETVKTELRDAFNDAQHSTLEASYTNDPSPFNETIRNINHDLEKQSIKIHDFVFTAVDRFSGLVPEMGFYDSWSLINSMIEVGDLAEIFHTPKATVHQIITMWMRMQAALRDLGHSFYKEAFSDDADTVLETYNRHRQEVLKAFDRPSVHTGVVIEGKPERVIMLAMNSDFWMARRMIQMTDGLYHNTRLIFNGLHTETNIPGKYANSIVGKARTKSQY